MTKNAIFRVTCLLFVLGLISTACAWIPFTAPVTINSTPEGASVYKVGEDEPVGITPFSTRVFHFNRNFEVRKEGFFDAPILIDFNTTENIHVKLDALPVLVYTKPDADIYTAGSDTPTGNTPIEVDVYAEDRSYTLKVEDYYDKEITLGLATKNPVVLELEHRPIITLTAPAGVGIYENGALLGTGSITQEIQTDRTFTLRKEGYFDKTVTLSSTSPYGVDVEMVPLPIVTIKTIPANASIYLVGEKEALGKGALTLAIKQATGFEVKADRYYPETFNATLETQTAEVKLKPMPYVTIISDPAGAEILLDGKLIGVTPLEQLIEKETTYELRQENYKPQTLTLNGKNAQPVARLEAYPIITIDSFPAGAAVSIDGEVFGNAPVEQMVKQPISVVVSMEKYWAQTNTLDGSDLTPTITLVEKTLLENLRDQGITLPLIGGIAAAIIAALIILIVVLLKKKKTA